MREVAREAVFDGWLSPIILAGSTAMRKSRAASALIEMAATHDVVAEVITADKYYLYGGERFMLGVGLTPEDLADDRRPHLVGSLQPNDPLPSPRQYVSMLTAEVDALHAQGKMAIVEGCSFSYTMAALGHFGMGHGIRVSPWHNRWSVKRHIAMRFCDLLDRGLWVETERAMAAGYEGTYPMSSLIYWPMVQVVKGNLHLERAKDTVIYTWLREAKRVEEQYDAIPSLQKPGHPFNLIY